MSFPWAYIDIHSSLSASGPTGSIQFRGGDAGPYSTLTGSHNLMFYTASSLLALTGTMELIGTASANQINVNVVDKTITNFSASGDTKFGAETTNIHRFTGSVNIGGALSASGEIFAADAFRLSGDVDITGTIKNTSFVSSSGEVYGTSLKVSGKEDGTTGLSVSGSIAGSSFISSSGEIFSAGGLRNSGTGDSNIAFSGTLNNKSFISASGEVFAGGGLRASGTGSIVSGTTDFKDIVSITGSGAGAIQITGAADSLIVLNTMPGDALKEIAIKKDGTTQSSFGVDIDEHVIVENESTKDIILRTQNQNTIRIFGNQQAVEINGSGVTANATLDVNGNTNITSSLTVSGTVAFGDRRRAGVDTLGGGVLSVLGTLTASKGIALEENSFLSVGKKILLTGSALHASASFVSSSGGHFSISGSNVNGMVLSGSKLTLDHTDAGGGVPERGIVLSGAVGGPGSKLGISADNQVVLTSSSTPPGGPSTSVTFNKSNVFSGSANLKMNFENNTVTQTGKFQVKSGSSPATAPVVFEVDEVQINPEFGTQGFRARGKFYHIYSLNFGLTNTAQARTGRFLSLPPGNEGSVGTGAGVSPFYDGALTNSKSILNPSSGRVIMLMYRFDTDAGQYDPGEALSYPPLFFMRTSILPFSNGTAGNSFNNEEISTIHSVTASSHPGPDTVGGIDFRTGVGALNGHANITGSWSFGTGSMMNLHIRTLNGNNSPGNAYLTIVCEYDHLDEYVSGSGN